ncbi:hypothetical protein GCM10020216_087370 [Nonomuraea helvata]
MKQSYCGAPGGNPAKGVPRNLVPEPQPGAKPVLSADVAHVRQAAPITVGGGDLGVWLMSCA